MTIGFTVLSAAEISNERERLLASTGLSVEELRARARSYALTPTEQGVLDQIVDLDYLADEG